MGSCPVTEGTPALRGKAWSRPVGGTGRGAPLLVYSLLIATFLGTMGLPHVLVRFYTNPDGHAARRTTVRVLGLLSIFYLFPAVYGALGRALTPQLYMTGQTDDVVLSLPRSAWPGAGGDDPHGGPMRGRLRRLSLDLKWPARLARRHLQPRRVAAPEPQRPV